MSCIYIYENIYPYMYIYMCLYIFTYIYIYIYTYTHIHIVSSRTIIVIRFTRCGLPALPTLAGINMCLSVYVCTYAHIYIHLQVKFLMYSAALCHICNLSPYICAVDFRQCQLMQSTLSTADVVSVGYVCIHTCMYVYMYIHVCMYTYTYMYVYTHIYIHTCMHAYRVCTYVHVNLRQ